MSQAVNSTLDLQTVLTRSSPRRRSFPSTEAGAIYVFDEAERNSGCGATYGMNEESIAG